MNRRRSSHLRLHVEENTVPAAPSSGSSKNSSEKVAAHDNGKAQNNSASTRNASKKSQSKPSPVQPSKVKVEPTSTGQSIPTLRTTREPIQHETPSWETTQDEVAACLRSFSTATGWAVRSNATKMISNESGQMRMPYDGFRSETSNSRGRSAIPTDYRKNRWRLIDSAPGDGILSADDLAHFPTVTLEHAEHLLLSIEHLVARLEKAEEAVRRQEAELATNVSITRSPDEQQELADRIDSVLASACKSIEATAAAVYLLDETTSTLKMRSCWGMPSSKLADPPRNLRGSLGDLEALLGNAVLLEDTAAMPEWETPEDFASAIVVPIGSVSMPHGTIWFWSKTPRKYSSIEIEVANLTSGRVMSELEHSILGGEAKVANKLRKQMDAAGLAQAARLPDSQPLHPDFEIDGWTFQGGSLGGGFHDWDMTPNLMMVASVGSAARSGPAGALVATSLQTTIRTLWPTGQNPCQILRNSGDVLFGIEDADWTASAALFQINPETGYGTVANAGKVQSFVISERGFRPIGSFAPKLASQPDPTYNSHRFVLQPGEILVAFSDTVIQNDQLLKNPVERNRRLLSKSLDQNSLLQSVRQMADESATDIASHIARLLPSVAPLKDIRNDRSLIVIKNTRKF